MIRPMTQLTKFLLTAGLLFWANTAFAACPKHGFTNPDKVRLNSDSVLIVTHANASYDSRFTSKRGIDEAVSYAKKKKTPVIYLNNDSPGDYYFMEDCKPDYWVQSEDGEIGFEVTPAHVYIVGGHLERCMLLSVNDILESWAKQEKRNLTLTYLMDGIYSSAELIKEDDPFYQTFEQYMRIALYGRSDEDDAFWAKLSVLETMGIINKEKQQINYLKRALPKNQVLFNGYQIELQLNDLAPVVLKSPGISTSSVPTLRFHFVDSAITLDAAEKNPPLKTAEKDKPVLD